MKTKSLSLALIIIGFCSAFAMIHEELHQAMMRMMDKMKSMKMTGDADHDFAMMMAEHHQGSIDMSRIIVKQGKDEKIKAMAQSILDKQSQEQQQLRAHTNQSNSQHAAHNQNSDAGKGGFKSEMDQAMKAMESDMNNMQMTNNVDHDFATMMIPHHESAIEMSDAIIKYGKDNEIKKTAEKTKSDSQKEIAELKQWLQAHDK